MVDSDIQGGAPPTTTGPLSINGALTLASGWIIRGLGTDQLSFTDPSGKPIAKFSSDAAAGNQGGAPSTVAVGGSALENNAGDYGNTAVGERALQANVSGQGNTAVGQYALKTSTGTSNTAVGQLALENQAAHSDSTAVGTSALQNADANNNVAVGAAAGNNLTGGTTNTLLGWQAGSNYIGAESYNIVIDNGGGTAAAGESYHIRIGRHINLYDLSLNGLGVPAIYGLDARVGLTAADGAAITLYAVPATANPRFVLAVSLVCQAYTSGTGTYTLTWTDPNGTTHTLTVSLSATGQAWPTVPMLEVAVKPSTNITGQLTGTFVGTFDPHASVKQVA